MGLQDRRRLGVAAAGVAALVAIAAVAGYAGWRWMEAHGLDATALTPAAVAQFVRGFGVWGPVGAIGLMVLHSFVPLPAEVIALGNGMIFGPTLGVAVTWSGAMLGAILSFALARWLGLPFVRLVLSAQGWRRLQWLPRHAGMLFAVRLVPVISFNLINYAAGLGGVGWWTFLWTTALGILPLTIVMVVLGHHMGSAPAWLWAGAAIAVLGSWLLWRRQRRR